MENKAHYILIGGFVFAGFLSLLFFILWFSAFEVDREFRRYHIYFTTDVSGLIVGSPVKYRGIPVGEVKNIRLDPYNIERVLVAVDIDSELDVKKDVVASLAFQGITGNIFVQLSGGKKESPSLMPRKSKDIGIIPSTPSNFETLISSIPEVLVELKSITKSISEIVSEENKQAISNTLKNIEVVTAALAANEDGVPKITKDLDVFLVETTDLIKSFKGAPQEVKKGIRSFENLSNELTQLALDSQDTVRTIQEDSLEQLNQALNKFYSFMEKMNFIAGEVEKNPLNFVVEGNKEGIPAP